MKWLWRICWSIIALAGVLLAIYINYAIKSPGGDDWGPAILFFIYAVPIALVAIAAFVILSIFSIAANYKKSRTPLLIVWGVIGLQCANGSYVAWRLKNR